MNNQGEPLNEICPFCREPAIRWMRKLKHHGTTVATFMTGCKFKDCHIKPLAVCVVSDKFPNGKTARAEADRRWNDRGTSIILLH